VLTVETTIFTSNLAGTKGGAVSWNKLEPQNISTNTFTSNIATVYGNNIGAVAESIVAISQTVYNQNFGTDGDLSPVVRRNLNEKYNEPAGRDLQTLSVSNHQSGKAIETLYFALVDMYNVIVKYGNSHRIEARVRFVAGAQFPAILSGTTSFNPTRGVIEASGVVLSSTPNTIQTVEFTSNDLRVSGTTTDLTVNVRNCINGEALLSSGA
jgi:hypothetical protein